MEIKRLEVGDVFFNVTPWHHDRSFIVVITETGDVGLKLTQDVTHSLRETS